MREAGIEDNTRESSARLERHAAMLDQYSSLAATLFSMSNEEDLEQQFLLAARVSFYYPPAPPKKE